MSRRNRAHQLVDQAADHAEALVDQVSPLVEAVREQVRPTPKPRRRGRKVLTALAVLAAVAAVIARNRDTAADESPRYAPSPPARDPEPEDLSRLEDEAPPVPVEPAAPPEGSLNSFFEELDQERTPGSRRS
jgi:hypothetical protein